MTRERSLPIVLGQAAGQRFDCHACTHCCRDLLVRLLPSDRERLDARDWGATLGVPPYVKHRGDWVLNKHEDGRCVFLEEDGKCRIHREQGRREKPLACQLYPFRIVPTAERWHIGWRFDCPSVARSQGQPVPKHEHDLRKLAAGLSVRALDGVSGGTDHAAQDAAAAALAHVAEKWLSRPDVTFAPRLESLASLATILGDPSFSQGAEDGSLVHLVESLGAALETADSSDLAPASSGQRAMLRQAIFAYGERVTFWEARSAWHRLRLRWEQLVRASRLRKGQGLVPPMAPGARAVSFDQVEGIHAADQDARAIEELLSRYLRVMLGSRAFYGPAYYGWPAPLGFAALLLRVPLVGWLARYQAAIAERKTIAFDDVVEALGTVDGGAGRLPALGSQAERLRMGYLLRDQGLRRLTRTYAPI